MGLCPYFEINQIGENIMTENVVVIARESELGDLIVISRRGNYTALGLPGGKIDEGESALEAMVREIQEELGVTVDPFYLRLVYSGSEGGVLTHAYLLEAPMNITASLDTINSEDCMITTVIDLVDLTDPTVSPFWEYNTALLNALESIPK